MIQERLRGEKVVLREMVDSDLELIFDWENRSELWYLGDVHEKVTEAEISNFINHSTGDIYTDGQLRLMINDFDGRTVGCIDLFEFDRFNLRSGVGILIAENADRNKGFASEALKLLTDYSFEVLNLRQLHCHITVDNDASMRLFTSCGFIQSGHNRDWVKKGNVFIDAIFMQRLNG